MAKILANRYEVISLIGQGGMADVYKAYDTVLNRMTALKILKPALAEDPALLMRFLREATAARKLHHPNVVDIYDVGECEGLHYIVMEYIDGRTLKQIIVDNGPMEARQAVQIMLQLTSAIRAAHQQKIIHRDIKPQNILITRQGIPKVTDFGIAVAADEERLSQTNAVMGSAHYLAPESAAGDAPDYRVDIYSLGIVFFELLCGGVPFSGTSPAQIALKHMQDPLPSILPYNKSVSQGIENIVIRATAKNPDERYQSTAELEIALRHAFDPARKTEPKLHLKTQSLELKKPEPEQTEPEIPVRKPLPSAAKNDRNGWKTWGAVSALTFLLAVLIGAALVSSGLVPVPGVFGWQQVPSTEGLTQQQALAALEEAGFENITVEDVLSDTVTAGRAVSLSARAGSFAKTQNPLILEVSKGPSFLISDYTGQYLEDIQTMMKNQGVSLQYEIAKQGAANTNPGVILKQSGLEPGERIDPSANETIEFVVSDYPQLTIPQFLIGMPVEEAKEWLNEQGIAVVPKEVNGGSVVSDVSPSAGSLYVQEGTNSFVTLYY